ncbi:MAG: hypothetical protein ACK5Y2_13340 [Bdellovibrionales bacterium]
MKNSPGEAALAGRIRLKCSMSWLESLLKQLERRSAPKKDSERGPRADPQSLQNFVQHLVSTPEPRNYQHPEQMKSVAKWIARTWQRQGLPVETQVYQAGR